MNVKIVAVVLAVIVVAGGVGAVFVINNQNKGSVKVDASLGIMGNANGDSKIDSADIDIINKIISGELKAEDYPLADADNNSKVEEADKELVNKMINHEEGIKINVVCKKVETQYIQEITYPLKRTVVVGTNLLSTTILVGAADYVIGYTQTNYGISHKPIIDHATKLGNKIFDMADDTSKNNFKKLDAEKHVDCVIAMPSASYLKESESMITAAGIPVVRLDSSDGLDAIGGALTLGFMYGSETEKISYKMAEKSYEVLNTITEKVKNIKAEDKKTFFAVTMGYYISEKSSPYDGVCEFAGGRSVSTLEGNGSTALQDGDEFYKTWNPNYIISFRTLDYSIDYTDITKGKTQTPKQTWESYNKWFNMLGDSYKHMVYINTSMPVICRMAYVAEIFYPDLFEEGYADKIHQEFVDEYMSYLGENFDVTKDMTTVITYDMVYPAA